MNSQQIDDILRRNLESIRARGDEKLTARYSRGINLYRAGRLLLVGDDDEPTADRYHVDAREGHDPHIVLVQHDAKRYADSCTCEDYQFDRAPRVRDRALCKHIVAARLQAKYGYFAGYAWGESSIVPALAATENGKARLSPRDNLPAEVYADGQEIEAALQSEAELYRTKFGRQPASRENLVGWIYR